MLIQLSGRKVRHCIGKKASPLHTCDSSAAWELMKLIPVTLQGWATLGDLGNSPLGREFKFSLLDCFVSIQFSSV